MAACNCLYILLDRKAGPADTKLLCFPFAHMETICKSPEVSSGDHLADHLFISRLCQVLTSLAIHHLRVLDASKIPESYSQFLYLLVATSNHPSHNIALASLPFWSLFLANTYFKSQVRKTIFFSLLKSFLVLFL